MNTSELLKAIKKLPIEDRITLAEGTLKSVRLDAKRDMMAKAVHDLQHVYQSDKELTVFTSLDTEEFYEPR